MTSKFVALVVLIFATIANAQTPAGDVSKTLMALEQRWGTALQKADVAMLNTVLADKYSDTDEQGHLGTKQDVLGALKSGDLRMGSLILSSMNVQAYGDAAIVTGVAAQKGTYQGHPLALTVRFTDTFVKQNGQWQAVASHRSVMP
ncbi:MAG TPA: nuclear transport factor 2 family protein [Rhizomicrobium sp.]|nr:nuclear transport factor 2 family protein [Rhizomicrobium sp.]